MPLDTKNRIICTGCSLLCDDIATSVQFNAIQKVYNACLRGNEKIHYSSNKARLKEPLLSPNGNNADQKTVSYDEALESVAELLKSGKKIAITGLYKISNGAQAAALELAKKIDATLLLEDLDVHKWINKAISKVGINYFTLGESINNSDMIVFWGSNPIDDAPKLVVKSVFSRGRYRQTGKEVKKFVVIDDYPTPTMERADVKLIIPGQKHKLFLMQLLKELLKNGIITRKQLEKMDFSIEAIEKIAEPDPTIKSQLNDLISQLKYTEYITIFLGTAILNKQFLNENIDYLEKFLSLITALNEKMRVALIPLKYSYNSTGFFQEYEMSDKSVNIIDLHHAFNSKSDYDVLLCIGSDIISKLSIDNLNNLQDTSIIALDYKHTPTTELSHVIIPVAITGLESEGLVTRMDNIVLKLTAPLKNSLLDDENVLNRLLELI